MGADQWQGALYERYAERDDQGEVSEFGDHDRWSVSFIYGLRVLALASVAALLAAARSCASPIALVASGGM